MLSQLPVHEALSGVSGSISLACWLFVLVPQLVENYQKKTADGISLWFLAVWFLGDVTNLLGALWAHLVPTVIALAVYFCVADTVLIIQCVYYNHLNACDSIPSEPSRAHADDASKPLLGRRVSGVGLPVSIRRRSSGSYHHQNGSIRSESLPLISEAQEGTRPWVKNFVALLAVCALGTVGWTVAWKTGIWKPIIGKDEKSDVSQNIGALILGYISAVCYLGARIPQIIKNFRDKSCEGLAILFFILSLTGNLTFGGGIMFHSLSKDYLITNLPWLIGSLGTIGEDILVFVQFHIYRKTDQE